jgi:hypothetical protein
MEVNPETVLLPCESDPPFEQPKKENKIIAARAIFTLFENFEFIYSSF